MRYLVLLFLIIYYSLAVLSQNQTFIISGQLVDNTTNEPLEYANIGLLRSSDSIFIQGTTTDLLGKFELRLKEKGSYLLRFSFIGYPTNYKSIVVEEQKQDIGKIGINKSAEMLADAVVSAQKLMYQYEADKKIYNVSEDASVSGGSASDALQNAPGVWVDLEGNISLRGVSDVEIWINDKPSRIPAEGLQAYLQQLPANTIERIEVMTNPSSKYTATGTGGVINIVTKQKISQNSLLSFGLNAGSQPSLSPWISFVWSNNKLKFNTYLGRSSNTNIWTNTRVGRVLNNGEPVYSYNSFNETVSKHNWYSLYFDVEYNITENTTLNLYAGGSSSSGESTTENRNNKYDFSALAASEISQDVIVNHNGQHINTGAIINHNFINNLHYITASYSLGQWESYRNNNTDFFETGLIQRERKYSSINNYDSKWSDFDVKYFNNFLKKYTFESGFSYNNSSGINTLPVDTFSFITNEWFKSLLYSNENNTESQKVNSYVSWAHKINKFDYKMGLRAQYQNNILFSVPLDREVAANYFGLFPSAHLSYQTARYYSYSLSYSRRVQYPNTWFLDPFINYLDEEMIWRGNPELKPAYTNSVESSFSKFFEKIGYFSASLYHRHTDKSHTRTTEAMYDAYLQRYTLYSFLTNSGRDLFTGGEITFNYRPKPYINVMLNTNLYYKDIYADLGSYTVSRSDFTYDSRLNMSLTFLKEYQLQLTGFYNAENPNLQGYSDARYFANLSLRANYFKRKLTVVFRIQDMFDSQKNNSEIITPSLVSTNLSRSNSKFYFVGLTYRIGKIEMEKEQKKGQAIPMDAPGM